jgi:hypothetical protein
MSNGETDQRVEGGESGISLDYLNAKRTYDLFQDLDVERARNNNAAANVVNMAAAQAVASLFNVAVRAAEAGVAHAKDQDEVAVRVAHNGAGADKAFDEQAVFDARARSAAVWGTGTTPPTMAASSQGADDIGEGDERE